MADTLETSHHKTSDVFTQVTVCSSLCEYGGVYEAGSFHCQKCSKYFCDSCVFTHNKFHKDHSVTHSDVNYSLELCEEHPTEKLTMFCEDDKKLLCHICHLRNHKQCREVVLLTDKIKYITQFLEVAHMKTSIASLIERLVDMIKKGEQNTMSLQMSYEKVLEEIVDVRRMINDNLDRLQQTTERKLEELHSTLKNSLENTRKHCVEFISKIKRYTIKDTHKKSPERSFIMFMKFYDQIASADLFLRKATTNAAIEFQHNTDLDQFFASCTDFGSIERREDVLHHCVDPYKVVSVMDKSQYNVRTVTDKYKCSITGICESSHAEFIMADENNECVKLLDRGYNLIEQIQLPTGPRSMCNISSNEIAVTTRKVLFFNEIYFFRVDKGRIVKFQTLQLNHACYGFASHQGDLFVTSGTAVCQYTMDGRLVKTLYENKKSDGNDVVGVGVSPDGQRIYVTESRNGKLLTLTRDGAVTAMLQDPAFKNDYVVPNVHVAATGQFFVFGKQSVSQTATDGKNVLKTIQLNKKDPRSVYFNEETNTIMVGFIEHDNVIELKTNVS